MSLPNHYGNNMSPNHDPRAPGSKYLRTNMGPYPGGVSYLTPNYINNDRQVNKAPGRRTNGSIRTTVHTRTRDQNVINVDQFAFMDVRKVDSPVLYNLQTINWMLASDDPNNPIHKILSDPNSVALKKFNVNGDLTMNRVDAEKAFIMESFKLYGVVVNRDVDNDESMPKDRISRTFTTTVKDVCNIMDYFSTKKNVLKPYNSCYFVLKKVQITKDMTWENVLTAPQLTYGSAPTKKASITMIGEWKWQIIPYHNRDNVLPVDLRTWTQYDDPSQTVKSNNPAVPDQHHGVTYIGGMWKLGKIHEYPDICIPSAFEKRVDETCTARNITLCHGNGRITPIHFYLSIKTFY